MSERVSIKPSDAQAGGNFGFPAGSTVTIQEAAWARAEEAGERFYARGKATADDPVLKLVGLIEGEDDPREPVFLRAGSASRLIPSDDGEELVKPEGSSATGLADKCNAMTFLMSIFYKDKNSDAYKKHGKMAIPESKLEDPISVALVGLKFVAGRKAIEFDGLDTTDGKKPQPTLVADEILEHPTGTGKLSGSKKASKKKPAEDDDEDEPAPKKGKTGSGGGSDKAISTAAEKAILAALESPKYRAGIPAQKAYVAAYKTVEGEDNEDKIMELVKDDDWMQDKKRPWTYDSDDEVYKSVD